MKFSTKPLVVAICNAIAPGLGYILIGRRTIFGWLLLPITIISIVIMFTQGVRSAEPPMDGFALLLGTIGTVLSMAAFGYDAFQEASAAQR